MVSRMAFSFMVTWVYVLIINVGVINLQERIKKLEASADKKEGTK